MSRRLKVITLVLLFCLILAGIYVGCWYGIFELREEQKVELPRATIFYDGTNETTREGAFDLEWVIENGLEVRMVNITSGFEMIDCFNESTENCSEIVVYFFHGNRYGMGVGNLTGKFGFFMWPVIAKWINISNSTHFIFATCYSGNLTFFGNKTYRVFVPPYEAENISNYKYTSKINLSYNCTELLYCANTSKSIYTFAGEVDYEVIVIYCAEEINRIVRAQEG